MATIRQQKGILERDDKDRVLMTTKNLITLCEEDGLYEYPELNSKIYLHFKGFHQIQNLDTFINLKTVYLENNMIKKIEGLGSLNKLEHLMLQHNAIEVIEGLENNINLISLNLSHNLIKKVAGVNSLFRLENLSLGFNRLSDTESIEELAKLPELSCCGLEDNQLKYDDGIMNVLVNIPKLKVLYMQGNDFIRECKFYRKTLIGKIKLLTYLDERPVFQDEREQSEAFVEGGKEQMNQLIKENNNKREETKRKEREEGKNKREEIRLKRMTFFEKQMKRGLVEVEGLKKKLNRARLVCDGDLIDQLQEQLNKENNMITELEVMLQIMRQGHKQIQEKDLRESSENHSNGFVQTKFDGKQSGIDQEDINKLLSSILHGTVREEEFEEERVIENLESTISSIVTKMGMTPSNMSDLFRKEEILQKVAQFKEENPQHVENIRNQRREALFSSNNGLKPIEEQEQSNEDSSQPHSSQPSYVSLQDEQANYLDDLE